MELIELIEAVQAGDQAAFTELVQRYEKMAFGYAVALVEDFHLAQDIVQEAFLISYFMLPRLQVPAAFPSWLRGIVRYQSARARRKRHHPVVPLDHIHDVPETGLPLDEEVIAHEARIQTLAALTTLPEAQRIVVILFYMYDFTQQEVATFLDVPLTTVNNRLHSARKGLKRRILARAKETFMTHGLPDDFAINVGNVVATHGSIIDVRFAPEDVPSPLTMLSDDHSYTAEVVQSLGNDTVRCVLVAPHQPIAQGTALRNTGTPTTRSLHSDTVHQLITSVERTVSQQPQILQTGIKVIDFFCPYLQGGTVGIFGDMRAGKLVLVEEVLHNLASHNESIALFAFAHTEDIATSWYGKTPTSNGSVQTMYVPVTDPADTGFAHSFADLDAVTFLARFADGHQIWPAVDPLRSTSRALDPTLVGEEHATLVQTVCRLLHDYPPESTFQTKHDQRQAKRARQIRAFCSQPFFVAEPYTGRPGQFVPRSATLQAFKELLAGTYDDIPVEAFLWCGTIDQAIEKAKTM